MRTSMGLWHHSPDCSDGTCSRRARAAGCSVMGYHWVSESMPALKWGSQSPAPRRLCAVVRPCHAWSSRQPMSQGLIQPRVSCPVACMSQLGPGPQPCYPSCLHCMPPPPSKPEHGCPICVALCPLGGSRGLWHLVGLRGAPGRCPGPWLGWSFQLLVVVSSVLVPPWPGPCPHPRAPQQGPHPCLPGLPAASLVPALPLPNTPRAGEMGPGLVALVTAEDPRESFLPRSSLPLTCNPAWYRRSSRLHPEQRPFICFIHSPAWRVSISACLPPRSPRSSQSPVPRLILPQPSAKVQRQDQLLCLLSKNKPLSYCGKVRQQQPPLPAPWSRAGAWGGAGWGCGCLGLGAQAGEGPWWGQESGAGWRCGCQANRAAAARIPVSTGWVCASGLALPCLLCRGSGSCRGQRGSG